jgi:hypothetical protein
MGYEVSQKVLLVASGFSSRLITEYNYIDNGWTIIVINHGWMATDDWKYWVRSSDFKGNRPTIKPDQIEISNYSNSLGAFGGHGQCGFSITLCAAYWSLQNLKPNVVGFLGADMNYTPNKDGHTHIYGKGLDIIKNGIPDPDRMVNKHSKDDPNYLKNIYNRFAEKASERGCSVYNFSNDPNTRLPYPKKQPISFE